MIKKKQENSFMNNKKDLMEVMPNKMYSSKLYNLSNKKDNWELLPLNGSLNSNKNYLDNNDFSFYNNNILNTLFANFFLLNSKKMFILILY